MTGSLEEQRPSWDEYFLSIAEVVSTRSPCLRANWGALLVDKDYRVISFGYNGPASGFRHCEELGCYREENDIPSGEKVEKCRAIHAEQNALIQAGRDEVKGSTLYLCGVDPRTSEYIPAVGGCILCAKQLVQAGVERTIIRLGPNGQSPFYSYPKKGLQVRARGQDMDYPEEGSPRHDDPSEHIPPHGGDEDPNPPGLWRNIRHSGRDQ